MCLAINSSSDLTCDGVLLQDVMEKALFGAREALVRDLSVHVCFICVLHLANEHGLRITGVSSLDQLEIGNITLDA